MCDKQTTAVEIGKKRIRIDKCMKSIVERLNKVKTIQTLACCCGHKKYPMTIVCRIKPHPIILEIMSNKVIPRKKRFYIKDKKGVLHIPETIK